MVFAKLGWDPTVPKYSGDFDVTRRQVDIDIAAHYICHQVGVLIRVPICVELIK